MVILFTGMGKIFKDYVLKILTTSLHIIFQKPYKRDSNILQIKLTHPVGSGVGLSHVVVRVL